MAKNEIRICLDRKSPLVLGNKTFLSSTDFTTTKDDLEKAYLQFNETEDVKCSSLKKLKEMLSKDKTLEYRADDDFLLRYLRHRKFNCEKAYTAIRKLYSMRMKNPEVFALMPNLESILDSNLLSILPYKDEEGSVLFWLNFKKWNLKEISFLDLIRMYNAFADIITMNSSCQINGIIDIFDFSDVTANHIANTVMNTRNLLLLSAFFQEAHPWKVKWVIGINCNVLIRTTYQLIRPILKKKIADRVRLLGSNIEDLHQYVNPVLLPKQYGGSLDESECNMTKHIMDNVSYLEYERSFGYGKK